MILPIKKKWFDMILRGEKKEEYREIKPYYDSRFYCKEKKIFNVVFRNGYSRRSRELTAKCRLKIGFGREEWGAEKERCYYILEILEIIK